MKKLFIILLFLSIIEGNNKIKYGYDFKGNYVPQYIGNNKIKYGYDFKGNYVPQYIGNNK